jgi:16S rRNA (cytosine967-C5)-methyltransferase
MKGTLSRRVAVEVLLKVELESAYANLALAAAFKRKQLSERDRAFVTFLVQGVIRNTSELDSELSKLTDRPLSKLATPLKIVLRVALYQLIHMKNIPQSAVLNTACQVARSTGHEGSAKFANAVLRKFIKTEPDQSGHANDDPSIDGVDALSQRYSIPSWLVSRWMDRFDAEETKKLLEFCATIPKLTLRTAQISVRTSALQEILQSRGMKLDRGELVPACLIVQDRGPLTGPVNKIPGYDEGLFCVQDEAAALVACIVAPQTGWTIVDLCAAPGGKTIHLGELMGNSGRVIAVDIHENRLNLLASERRRIGLTNIDVKTADGRTFKPDYEVDAVLIDAPCTGTGVINRRSDLRRKRQAPDLQVLVETQRDLLTNAASFLKPGGILVYSTCSIEEEENQQNIRWFLENNPGFSPQPLRGFLPQGLVSRWQTADWWSETEQEMDKGMLQLLPSRQGYSGFFVSRLKREQ